MKNRHLCRTTNLCMQKLCMLRQFCLYVCLSVCTSVHLSVTLVSYVKTAEWIELVFTARLHVMQRTVLPRPFCPSVCPSVRLSVWQTRGLWRNERKLCPYSYTTLKIIYPSSLTRRTIGGGDALYLKFGPNWPCWSQNVHFLSIFALSASAIPPSEKKFN